MKNERLEELTDLARQAAKPLSHSFYVDETGGLAIADSKGMVRAYSAVDMIALFALARQRVYDLVDALEDEPRNRRGSQDNDA